MNIAALTCRLCFPLLFVGLIGGCGALPEKPSDMDNNSFVTADPTTDRPSTDSITDDDPLTPKVVTIPLVTTSIAKLNDVNTNQTSFPSDTLYSLLVAEVAASRRQYATTIDNYVAQAQDTRDKSIIIRATRITQFLRAHQDSIDMGLLWLEQEPDNREALTTVANAYIELQQPLQALDYTEQIINNSVRNQTVGKTSPNKSLDSKPIDGGALIETLANYSKKSSPETLSKLTQRIQTLSETYPTLAGIKVGLSTLQQAAGRNDIARSWIDAALAQEPNRTSAIIQDVRLLQSTQQSALALSKLEQYVKNTPNNHRVRLVYARLLSQSNIPQAYKQFTILSEQAPQQLDLRFSRALLATELEKMAVALPLFEYLLLDKYQEDSVNFYLGHIHDFQENTDTALQYYLAVKKGNNYLPAQYRMASIFSNKQQFEKVQRLFNRLHQELPDKTEQLYEDEASLLVKHKANTEALILLNKAIPLFPDNASLRYERATIYERLDQLALMEKDFRHVLNKDTNNIAALNGLGYLLTIRTTRYGEAYTLIRQALELSPEDPSIIDSMGWVLFKLGRIEEAITHLQKAYEQFPDPEVAAHLGEALWANGKKTEAKGILRENLKNNPDAEEVLDTLRRLNITL
jgi:tetratricopeptide (TPR) repeat protein